MSDAHTYRIDLSPETADWLEATAEACNVSPEGVIRLLVIATMFSDDDPFDLTASHPDAASGEASAEDESGTTTRALLREALAAIHATRPTPESGPATIVREDVRSMFEMMRKAAE